jgi:hypothetical protein
MTGTAYTVHDLTLLAKARLDELDGCVSVMEERMASTDESTRLAAHLALLDARKWREGFRARTRDLRRTVDSGANQARRDLDEAWNEFENAFGRWIAATGLDAAEMSARTQAHLAAWNRLVAHYKTKLQADEALRALEAAAAAECAKLAKLQAAGIAAYDAWMAGLKQSRTVFEESLRMIRAQLDQTGN